MQSEQINELAAALAKAQGSFDDVIKGKTAKIKQGFEYSYADLASVLQAVRKPLSENGLALAQLTHSEGGSFWLESRLMHNSGQYITATWPLPAQATPQQMGSALTYARRYTASALLGIASEDDDGAAGGEAKPSSGPPKVEQKDKPPFWQNEAQGSPTGGAATNGGGGGKTEAVQAFYFSDRYGEEKPEPMTEVAFCESVMEELNGCTIYDAVHSVIENNRDGLERMRDDNKKRVDAVRRAQLKALRREMHDEQTPMNAG